MPEVSGIGAVDYAQQYQQPQYVSNEISPEEYSAYPAYDPAMEQPKSSGMGLLSASLLALGVGTLAFIGGRHVGKKAGENAKELAEAAKTQMEAELNALKNSEAVKNYAGLKTAVEDTVKEANEETWSFFKPHTWFTKKGEHKFSIKKFKEKVKDFVDVDIKKAEDEVEKAAEKGKDSTKKAKDKKD